MKKATRISLLIILSFTLLFILASCTLLDRFNGTSQSGDDGGKGIHLTKYEGSYYVDSVGNCTDKKIVIPSTFKGLPVTGIGKLAFLDCTFIEEVVIPDSVTWIGDFAFTGCTSLSKVTLPDTLTWVGDSAFYDCAPSLYNKHGNAYYVGNEANPYLLLSHSKDTRIQTSQIHNDTKVISSYAFAYCENLTTVSMGNNILTIGEGAFTECVSLTEITISKTTTMIDDEAFSFCMSLKSITVSPENEVYKSIDGVLFTIDTKTLIQYPTGSARQEYTIPAGTEKIETRALAYSRNLKNITISNGVEHIGHEAFFGCAYITEISIPKSVTFIDDGAFASCVYLKEIKVDPSNARYKAVNASLYDHDGKRLIQYCIGSAKNRFDVPRGVETIEFSAFSNAYYLQTVTFPDSVKSIEAYAFFGCMNMKSINLPPKLDFIGECAFSNCTSLAAVTLPATLPFLNELIFAGCSSLKSIRYAGTVEEWNSLEKPEGWNEGTGAYAVYCTDGTVHKNGYY